MLSTLITHAIVLVVGGGGGYYLHYKFGGTLSKDANVIKTAVQDVKKL